MSQTDSPQYRQRKAFFDQMLTIYGRKPVLEALQDESLPIYRLHLADSNREHGIVAEITSLAEARSIERHYHDRRALSHISRNGKQDQGVALDIHLPAYRPYQQLLPAAASTRVIALDRITNPQNLGMIIRSVCAAGIDGLLLPKTGCAALSPLVIKASAGTLFRAPLFYCDHLASALSSMKDAGFAVCSLSSRASDSLFSYQQQRPTVYVLGNETEGVSPAVTALCDQQLRIPLHNGVESLNVAVTAALLAFTLGAGNDASTVQGPG